MLMHTAQQAWDDRAEDYDDSLTTEQAFDIAIEELESTPAVVADWLQEQCVGHDSSIEVEDTQYGLDLTVPQLLAVLMSGDRSATLGARYQLLTAFRRAHMVQAMARADELLAAEVA